MCFFNVMHFTLLYSLTERQRQANKMASIDNTHLFTKRRVVYSNEENYETPLIPDFSVVQYNILHDIPKSHPGYQYCADQHKFRDQKTDSHRHKLLLSEVWEINLFEQINLNFSHFTPTLNYKSLFEITTSQCN